MWSGAGANVRSGVRGSVGRILAWLIFIDTLIGTALSSFGTGSGGSRAGTVGGGRKAGLRFQETQDAQQVCQLVRSVPC